MVADGLDAILRKGISAAEQGHIRSAQAYLSQVAEHRNTPELLSYLAYCDAKEHGRLHSAAKICRESIKRQPHNSSHYLILGRVLLMMGDRRRAINTFRQGLKLSPNPCIIEEIKKLGLRKSPVISSLDRSHALNRFLGKLFHRMGLR
ncbi:MAG: hypothetical protein C0622_05145 [Desulfuromonas sp.]|nr:MAG: hypothetical protein C0622_05145 [Desulfuromonas sp.]